MDFDAIWGFIGSSFPGAVAAMLIGLQIIGALTVIGTLVDKLIPDEKDGGFMSKVFAIPLVGPFLIWCKKFSPFNVA